MPKNVMNSSSNLGVSTRKFFLGPRVEFLQADFSSPKFGLPEADFKLLVAEVGAILHNAWRFDFNIALSSFDREGAHPPAACAVLSTGASPADAVHTYSSSRRYRQF